MHTKPHVPTRLLIVDDERTNLELLSRVFQQHDVTTASNGRDALEILRQQRFDVVLLDIMMPGMSGIDVLEQIRKTEQLVELPVILISALSERRGVAHGIRAGANDYIVKPVDIEDVQARVQTQIRLKQYVDERKQMIMHLQAMNERLERLMQVASHDLKNPLTNLNMTFNLLRRQLVDKPDALHLVDMAGQSAKVMLSVIEEFLDADVQQEDVLKVHVTPTDCRRLIHDVVGQFMATAQQKHIRIHAEELKGLVLADSRRLVQAIGNLVSNAIKYSPSNSDVYLSTLVQDGVWQLTVADSGPGVPEQERAHLFTPFAKLSTQPTAGESSTGLGLWIVREMMQLQGGEVGAYFPAEGGSHFWLQLPVASEGVNV